MAIDASIPLQTRVNPRRSSVDDYSKAMQLRNLAGQQRLQDMQMTQAETEMANTTRLSDLYASSNGDMDAVFEGQMKFDPKGAMEDRNKYSGQQTKMKTDEISLFLKKNEALGKLFGRANNQNWAAIVREGVDMELMSPEEANQLPHQYDQEFVNKLKQGFTDVKGGTTPSSVAEFEYRMTLPGGIGGKADKAFLEGKRQLQFLNTGQAFTGVGTAAGDQVIPINVSTDKLPENVEAAAEAGAQGSSTGKATGEAMAELADRMSVMPQLEQTVLDLSELGKKATYTNTGQIVDAVVRETGPITGYEATPGAIARKEYQTKVDNEILPLLRQTFGAQFTVQEGESLKATLGDKDASPEEKDAVLKSFIETKKATIKSMMRRTGMTWGDVTKEGFVEPPQTTPQLGEVQDGYLFKGGDPSNKANWEKVN